MTNKNDLFYVTFNLAHCVSVLSMSVLNRHYLYIILEFEDWENRYDRTNPSTAGGAHCEAETKARIRVRSVMLRAEDYGFPHNPKWIIRLLAAHAVISLHCPICCWCGSMK